jgi:membrane protein
MGSVVISILVIVFSLVILVYGEPLIQIIGLYMENILGIPFSFNQIWYALRWPLGIAVYFFAIGLLYYILPTEKLPYKKLIPGSVLASTGMLLVTWIYSFYTSRFANYDVLYGGLGTVIGLLMWFYILGYVIVIGIVFNAAISETAH